MARARARASIRATHAGPAADPASPPVKSAPGQAALAQGQQMAVDALAQRIKQSPTPVTIEGFAAGRDQDKQVQSLDRANRLRAQLVARGVDPAKIVAVGARRAGGTRRRRAARRERHRHGPEEGQ